MYRVYLSQCGQDGKPEHSVVSVERRDLREALFRVTDYLEAEVVGSWFNNGGEPLRLQLAFVLEVIHVPH